jgi:hypothetical protein
MNKTIKLILSTIFFLFSLALTTAQVIYADIPCDPYDCSGRHAYLRVDNCTTSSGTNCVNSGTTPYNPSICPTDGGSGSCTGTAKGVEGCGGNVSSGGTITECDCSVGGGAYDYQCTSAGGTCGSGGTYLGTCGNCTTYTNPGSCDCPWGSCGERFGFRGCCVITSTTPTPTPALWCGDETCSGSIGESCSNCELDCGCCGTCSSPTPTPPPGTPACSVSLSPSSYEMSISDSPFNITANISGLANGNVSLVQFSTTGTAVSTSPTFDSSSPYQTLVSPSAQGTGIVTVSVYMGDDNVVCSADASIKVVYTENEAPDCDSFISTYPNVTQGETANFVAVVTDTGPNLLADGNFESGTTSYFPTAHQLSEWWAVPNTGATSSPGADGGYYAKIKAELTSTDPHAATDWIEAGENLTNQSYTIKLKAKSHSSNESINRIYLQRYPFNGDWAGGQDISNKLLNVNPSTWTDWENAVTWPNPGNGTTTSRFRVVLRPGTTNGGTLTQPIYYDAVKAYKTSSAGVSDVNFYYIPVAEDPCSTTPNNWTHIGAGVPTGNQGEYEVNWDTSTIPTGEYIVVLNATDPSGNLSSGNPGFCGSPGITYRVACGGSQNIAQCDIGCFEDCGTGYTLAETPSRPAGLTVAGISSGRKDLTSSNSVQVNWTASTIPGTATIDGYDVWVFPQGTAAPANGATTCTGCQKISELNGRLDTSTTYIPQPAQTDEVVMFVRAKNTEPCGDIFGNWSTALNVDYVSTISGDIIESSDGPDSVLTNNCVAVGSTIDISSALPTISHSIGSSTTSPTGSYSLPNVPYAPTGSWEDHGFDITLDMTSNPDPANSYYCNCPGTSNPFVCSQTASDSPSSIGDENFNITPVDLSNGPWWQTSEGNVYGSMSYTNTIPDACDLAPICNANLITQNSDGDSKSAGIPMSGGGTLEANGFYTEYNDGGTPPRTQPRSVGTSHANIVKETFNHFVREIDLEDTEILPTDPTSLPTSGTVYEDAIVYYAGSGRVFNFSSMDTVPSGTKLIYYVDGDITLQWSGATGGQMIDVEEGGYVAFISSGDIIFDQSVGNDISYPSGGSMLTNIEGVFIADNLLTVADDGLDDTRDLNFVGEGTYVGWSGVDLQRTYDNTTDPLDRATNNEYPTELFIFRPDFNKNTPKIMLKPNLVWQEVN